MTEPEKIKADQPEIEPDDADQPDPGVPADVVPVEEDE